MAYWEKKTAIVTGGSAGLGFVMAQALLHAGANVVIAARDPARLNQAAIQLDPSGERILAVACDVAQPGEADRLVQETVARFGQIDLLVNNVGRSHRGRLIDVTVEQHREFFDTNVLTAVRCSQAAIPHLEASRGHLVNIGSLASKTASRFLGAYAVSKFPLAAFSQQLRLELAETGVHVLLVCPGPLARPDAGQRYDQEAADLPESARRPGGGARIKGLDPERVARRILTACQKRQPELVLPGKARLLLILAAISPRWGDWLLRKMTS
ncbi:SDR family NAD(P)-dependent oxidoreductase [Lignipirellula cremea]|uniref:Putative oxidoreductase n=1 Tax=Lignipirellula cremea TaxID=2528010 RepID=A0A518DW13_9BACT|nr:SDR family NAD(P)-dependent oxidoreductase [Lignipirellula cremea]QDU96028.1 putative oxidoreductase [Lignipirellula cremea]